MIALPFSHVSGPFTGAGLIRTVMYIFALDVLYELLLRQFSIEFANVDSEKRCSLSYCAHLDLVLCSSLLILSLFGVDRHDCLSPGFSVLCELWIELVLFHSY